MAIRSPADEDGMFTFIELGLIGPHRATVPHRLLGHCRPYETCNGAIGSYSLIHVAEKR